ncbi:MAG: Lrp/AsnC family transcriptional regulator [Formosimonas sp.]
MKKSIIDSIDIKILRQITKTPNLALSKVAEAVSISEASCWRRVKKLEENKIIDYQVRVNLEALGNTFCALVRLRVNTHTSKATTELIDAISNAKEVTNFYNISGEDDFILFVVTHDTYSYNKFINSTIRGIPYVTKISTSVIISKLKEHIDF